METQPVPASGRFVDVAGAAYSSGGRVNLHSGFVSAPPTSARAETAGRNESTLDFQAPARHVHLRACG
jgi:hypothetical protein